jgi:catechol 2,3-dioxygenase-like lactoylglutathione lyase family enzyme
MPAVSLNLVVISSANMQRSVAFYEGLGLKLTPEKHGTGPEHFSAELDGVVFEIYPQAALDRATGPARIGFRVASVDGTVVKLRKLGAEVLSEPKVSPWGRRAVVRDPDGYRIEISERPAAG